MMDTPLLSLVHRVQDLETSFSLALIEVTLRLSSLTDANVFLLVETTEGRRFCGKDALCRAFVDGALRFDHRDVEMKMSPTASSPLSEVRRNEDSISEGCPIADPPSASSNPSSDLTRASPAKKRRISRENLEWTTKKIADQDVDEPETKPVVLEDRDSDVEEIPLWETSGFDPENGLASFDSSFTENLNQPPSDQGRSRRKRKEPPGIRDVVVGTSYDPSLGKYPTFPQECSIESWKQSGDVRSGQILPGDDFDHLRLQVRDYLEQSAKADAVQRCDTAALLTKDSVGYKVLLSLIYDAGKTFGTLSRSTDHDHLQYFYVLFDELFNFFPEFSTVEKVKIADDVRNFRHLLRQKLQRTFGRFSKKYKS